MLFDGSSDQIAETVLKRYQKSCKCHEEFYPKIFMFLDHIVGIVYNWVNVSERIVDFGCLFVRVGFYYFTGWLWFYAFQFETVNPFTFSQHISWCCNSKWKNWFQNERLFGVWWKIVAKIFVILNQLDSLFSLEFWISNGNITRDFRWNNHSREEKKIQFETSCRNENYFLKVCSDTILCVSIAPLRS